MQIPTLIRRGMILALAAFASLGGSVLSAASDDPRLASATARELWRKGSDQVLAGDFASAQLTLEQFRKIEPDHTGAKDALAWMKGAEKLRASRERFRQRMYDYYTGKSLEAVSKAKDLIKNPPPKDAKKTGDAETSDGGKRKKSSSKPEATQAGDDDASVEGEDGGGDQDDGVAAV